MNYQLSQYSLRGSRPTNQDRVGTADRDNAMIMVLADGLGGHMGGELAAETLVQTVIRTFQNVKHPTITNPSAFLALSILHAHKSIVDRGKNHIPPLDPRTTCVVCLVQNGYAYWAHVGDSRLYYFCDDKLVQRTQDHTTIEELRNDGLISEEEMGNHPHKGHLLKCVGGPNKPTISLGKETLLGKGDTLLLCTDGLWEAFSPAKIGQYLKYATLDEGIEEMLLAAEKKMGNICDNISAVCLRWEDNVTDSLPLQSNQVINVDEDTLWENAATVTAAKRLKRKTKGKTKKDEHGSIESRIKEFEEYLKKFDPE